MASLTKSEQVATMFGLAVRLGRLREADALLIWSDGDEDWPQLKRLAGDVTVLVASDENSDLAKAVKEGLDVLMVNADSQPITEKIGQALLNAVSDDLLSPGAGVVAVYPGFDAATADSVSFIRLDEHLGRLTIRDLRNLKTRVPIETLKTVVDLAVAIGREGREGRPVGTLFVVGDARKVLVRSKPAGFDPVKGYSRKERSLHDGRVREGIKEIAQLDGAIIVSADGTVEAACRLLETTTTNISLAKGLGARHLAAAAITKNTAAVAITVSESNGSVRVFQHGRVMLHVEPFQRAMKWKTAEIDGSLERR